MALLPSALPQPLPAPASSEQLEQLAGDLRAAGLMPLRSSGELERPSHRDPLLRGLTDPEDPLHLDVLVPGGPAAYCNWFEQLSQRRSQ